MRQIGTIGDSSQAEAFSHYLLAQGMPNMVEEEPSTGKWSVWVENDDHLERAKIELEAFDRSPSDPRYVNASKPAGKIRKDEEKLQERLQEQHVNVRTTWDQPQQWKIPLTILLVLVSIVVTLGTWFGERDGATELITFGSEKTYKELYFKSPFEVTRLLDVNMENDPPPGIRSFVQTKWFRGLLGMGDIERGEVWRLLTPIFLHLFPLHLLFNMLWTVKLGSMIERRRGTLFLGLLVLVSGILANFADDFWYGPAGGGMSGVVYALFGYAWMRGRFDPEDGIGVPQNTIVLMLFWLGLCMTGAIGPVGNAAHVVGLIVGVVAGYLPVILRKMRRVSPTRTF